ncbi:MAG: type I 3-dehydroquinate dehydratase [Salinispira sp.]
MRHNTRRRAAPSSQASISQPSGVHARICLSLPGPNCAANISAMQGSTYSALEFRLDRIPDDLPAFVPQITSLTQNAELMRVLDGADDPDDFSIIITLRRKEDGGFFSEPVFRSEEILLELFQQLCSDPAWPVLKPMVAVDIEQQSVMQDFFYFMDEKDIRRIRSVHYFDSCPADISGILEDLAGERAGEGPNEKNGGDAGRRCIPKLAAMPTSLQELNRIIEGGQAFAEKFPQQPFILVAMGELGRPSRILPEKTGSRISFTVPDQAAAEQAAAENGTEQDAKHIRTTGSKKTTGRMPASMTATTASHAIAAMTSSEMAAYRFLRIYRDTPIFAIIGNPVSHSRSPEYHNRVFSERNLESLYIPLLCDSTAAVPDFSRLMNLRGASVTIPHKESVRSILYGESEACTITGACNTIYLDENGKWRGENTDVEGFLQPIKPISNVHSATVIGAGGAAKSVVYALLREGVKVLLLNRTVSRAEQVAADMEAYFPGAVCPAPLSSDSLPRIRKHNQLIVQTTSLGMEGNEDADPLIFYEFDGSEFLYDIIYTPPVTAIMKRAAAAGCISQNGQDMFIGQAEVQADIFARCLTNCFYYKKRKNHGKI